MTALGYSNLRPPRVPRASFCGVLLELSPYAFMDQPSETALMSWLRHFSCDSRFPADSSSVALPLHVPIVPMRVKVPVAPMLYIETSFEPEFVT